MNSKKLKQSLLAFACVFTMISADLSAITAEAAESESMSFTTIGITGRCGCAISTMDYVTVSRRISTVTDNGKTHVSYNITYICPKGHGMHDKTVSMRETHVFGPYQDEGHRVNKLDTDKHVYRRFCSCGDDDEQPITCMAPATAVGGHAIP